MQTQPATKATLLYEPTSQRVLVVDDDPGIRDALSVYLQQHGYAVETVEDGRQMKLSLARSTADLVILDLMLPGDDGIKLCRELSRPNGPAVIILSAVCGEVDRIVALELGADDYIAKPCNPRELLARVRAVLRGRRDARVRQRMDGVRQFAGWRMDVVQHQLRSPEGVVVKLASGQFALLRTFVERPQRILTRDQLLEYAGGPDADPFDRTIDSRISRLRRKLDEGTNGFELIRTIRNEGYMFVANVSPCSSVADGS
jgi:two-component system OmpR family response regulator